jgi:hypothetical protein
VASRLGSKISDQAVLAFDFINVMEQGRFRVPFCRYHSKNGVSEALTYAPNPRARSGGSGAGSTRARRYRLPEQPPDDRGKAKLAKTYGGVMELGQDATGDASLLKAIAEAAR